MILCARVTSSLRPPRAPPTIIPLFHALPVPPLAACSSGPHGTYAHLVWKNMRIAMALHTAHTKGVVAGHDGGGDARPGRIPCCAGRKA